MSAPSSGFTPARHLLRGSAWMVGLRWSLRLSGLVSTAILARLLTPGDFGVVAIAMLFVGLVETLGDAGERLALIRLPVLERAHYDTAFSLQLLIGLFIATSVFLLAPLTLNYFHEPRAVAVMRLLSLRAILSGLENIGTIDFRRDFRFNVAFKLAMRAKIASLLATLILAVWTRSYWALAIGILVNQAAITLLSYGMHPYRPRFSLSRCREIYGFSAWTLLRSIGVYLTSQVDQIVVGGFAAAGAMGRYAVALDVATSPTAEIHDPVVGVLYPVLAKCRDDAKAVQNLFLRVFGWSFLICIATSAGLTAVARDYCLLILGPQWTAAADLIPWLAISAGLFCVGGATDALFDSLGMPSWSAKLQWLRLVLLAAAAAITALLWRSIEAVAIARLAVTFICAPIILLSAARAAGLSARAYAALLWRPLLSALVMAAGVMAIGRAVGGSLLLRLAAEVPAGVFLYAGTLLLLWRTAGCPNGPEPDMTSLLRVTWFSSRDRLLARRTARSL